ncbi:hypothetical protein E4T48_04692 [Aureobasidium sp. EXF-10727]|nr:hypothetical protein E4T48_04692 [Aureobasidium sp. EXF-10727]
MTSLNLQRPVNKHSTPDSFNGNMLSQPYPAMPSPLKMHTVHVENPPNPEPVDISLPPSPTPNDTPVTQKSQNELEPLQKVTIKGQTPGTSTQQSPPTIPPKSPHRGAKKSNWLSRLLGRLSRLYGGGRNKSRSKKDINQPKDRKARDRST